MTPSGDAPARPAGSFTTGDRALRRAALQYLLGTSLARPCIARGLMDAVAAEDADAIAHGATGKGNDQVRFELAAYHFRPGIKIIAPWREWKFRGRRELIEYTQQHKIPIEATADKPYSVDRNLLHTSYEGGVLEDPWREPDPAMFQRTRDPRDAPDAPRILELELERGDAVALDGERLGPVEIPAVTDRDQNRPELDRIGRVWHRLVLGLVPGLVLAGCGFRSSPASGGGADAGPGDGAIDGSGAGDGSSATPDCWAHWMDGSVVIDASTVKEIMELSSTGHDLEPWISSDGLRMYFLRDLTPPGHGDIYLASRSSPTGTFGTATAVMPLNTPGQEGRAWLTSDELTIALSTTQDGPLGIDMTTRGAGQPFDTPGNGHLAMVNAKGTMRFDPFLTDDVQRLYFSANTGPGGKLQLWIATRAAAGDDFGMPALVPGITDNGVNELAPALYQGEQLLVFSSFPNNATADLFYATRSSATGNFGTATQIPTVNATTFSEIDPVLSQDGCELYFASDRDTDRHFHLFHAQITR